MKAISRRRKRRCGPIGDGKDGFGCADGLGLRPCLGVGMGVEVGLSEEFLVVVLFLALRDFESLAEGLLMGVPDPDPDPAPVPVPVPDPDDFLSDSQRDLRSE